MSSEVETSLTALQEISAWCFDLTLTCMTTDGVSTDIRRRARAAHNVMKKYRTVFSLKSRAEIETDRHDIAIDCPNYDAYAPADEIVPV